MEDLQTRKCISQTKKTFSKSRFNPGNLQMESQYRRIERNLKNEQAKFAIESVQNIIKDQFKQIQVRKNLQKDLQTYSFKVKNQLSPKERVDQFRERQKQKHKQALQKHKKLRGQANLEASRIIEQNEKKRKQRLFQQRKKENQIKRRIQYLSQTFHNNQKMLAQNLDEQRERKQRDKAKNNQLSESRVSLSSDRHIERMNSANDRIKSMYKSQELNYVTKYIKKSQLVEEKKIMKQIEFNKRRNDSIITPVKCTVHLRMQKQIAEANQKEKQLFERTSRFEKSRFQLLQRSKTATQERAFYKATKMQNVIRRKEERDKAIVQNAFLQYNRRALKTQQWRQNNSKQVHDELSDKILHQRFLIKKKIHERQQHHINKMNSIFRKIQNIKREYRSGKDDKENKLVECDKKSILKELDQNDRNINQVCQFLKGSKENFRNKMLTEKQGKKAH